MNRALLINGRTLETLSQSLDECRVILQRLYPNRDTHSLLPMSRQELIVLLDSPVSALPSQTSPTDTNTSPPSNELQSPLSNDDQSLSNLEQIPSEDIEWDEERRNQDPIPEEADDVNGLSLSVSQSSYLGATSIKAAFLVMLKVAPTLRTFLAPTGNNETNKQINTGNSLLPRPESAVKNPTSAIAWTSEGQNLIDAYFNRLHLLIPMLDEPYFRADYLAGKRNDSPWLALLNMVFAMGSISANKSDDLNHINFYNCAKAQLGIDSFGSGHLETLQALILIGGCYLHYINRPNMGSAISGAALRMACAMGLHRESVAEGDNQLIVEQRRRTWWSLFCLDTWESYKC